MNLLEVYVQLRRTAYTNQSGVYLLLHIDLSVTRDLILLAEIDLVKRVRLHFLGCSDLAEGSLVHRGFVFLVIEHVVL